MDDVAGVFFSQFAYVFLLGMQSRNVYHRSFAWAAFTSMLLGVAGLYLVRKITSTDDPATLAAYVLSGPVAIVTAIWAHPKVTGKE